MCLVLAAPSAGSAPLSVLEQRMQWFGTGALRGFALSELPAHGREVYTEADFEDLAATGANVVRVPIQLRKCTGCERYESPEQDIRYAQRVLARGERLGFRVVLVLLATPWGDQSDYWDRPNLQADIVRQWGQVARRVMASPALLAYDLINEPVVPASLGGRDPQARWQDLALAIAHELRKVDPDTPLMIEPLPWGLPSSLTALKPLGLPGVVYSFHFYAPHEFTHQGLPGHPLALAYPGPGWDKARLSQALAQARAFAAEHRVPLFVGEFACVRWAPAGSCTRYLADAIALFEAERWGWAYHCWRCYQGWDAEVPAEVPQEQRSGHLPDQRRADAPSLLLLKQALQNNRRRALP
jgi:endoglucanase